MVHRIRVVIFIVFLCGALAWMGGCSAEAPLPARTGSTADLSTDRAAAAGAIQGYGAELDDWAERFFTDADFNAFDFDDPLSPTRGELGRAKDFSAYAHTMLSHLRQIDPPPELAQDHYLYVHSIAAQAGALDRLLSGIENGNQRDIELAYRAASAAHAQEIQALDALSPHIDPPPLTEN